MRTSGSIDHETVVAAIEVVKDEKLQDHAHCVKTLISDYCKAHNINSASMVSIMLVLTDAACAALAIDFMLTILRDKKNGH